MRVACLLLLVPAVVAAVVGPFRAPGPTAPAPPDDVVREMRAEVVKSSTDPAGRPLPVAAHWARGFGLQNFSSDYQIELLARGHHVMPTLPIPSPGGTSYPGLAAVTRLAEWGAPFSLRVDQWENLLLSKDHPRDEPGRWRNLPPEQSPLTLAPNGQLVRILSPLGAVEPWYEVGKYYTASPAFGQLEAAYPDPPLVIMLSNNEARRLEPKQDIETHSRRYLDRYGTGRSDTFKRRVMAEGYIERYRALFRGLRDGMRTEAWRARTRMVGYTAFGPPHFGRWPRWTDYSFATDEEIDPSPHMWDGGSVAYYTHNWNASSDYRVFSPQVEAMNWVFMLEEAYRINPDFWFELSVWDGNSGGNDARRKDKAEVYRKAGQHWTPERYGGFVQYGMWLLTPRVVREFRGHGVPRTRFAAEFDALVAAVDRVWTNPTLKRFWRKGELVPNRTRQHPYQSRIPDKWKHVDRWFMLNTSLDPPAPWQLETELPVFTLARVLGEEGTREWLLYTYAPVQSYHGVVVEVPGFGPATVDATPAGNFYLLRETDRQVLPVDP
ncbi:hypothetical protein GQ464_008465 [Rhodocaloribacter litoris]|uniref:hypothetical protein n=1 Tax=Rhodocaloribacter litoris TaxID=2558931 RepID=UPI001E45776A|nr:hypothetical protein [Rhodocaloribacter litoris]QXD16952.1 hypothetical protein GQ464_008465 [Rhodocaloribacter litoris]